MTSPQPDMPDTTIRARWVTPLTACVVAALVLAYGTLLAVADGTMPDMFEAMFLYLVGLGAATIANSTGVGGGVVFLPAFEYLGKAGHVAIATSQIVGMSFVVQSFGMTTGSLRWLARIHDHNSPDTGVPPATFLKLLGTVLLFALPALLITQTLHTRAPEEVLYAFKAISLGLGLAVIVTTLMARGRLRDRSSATKGDYLALAALGTVGGIATAFFSVGVGELAALYLFVRNFPLITAASLAVIASAISVIAGVWDHLMGPPLPWEILLFVIPGAITGGYLARSVAFALGPERLKLFAAGWITLSSAWLIWLM